MSNRHTSSSGVTPTRLIMLCEWCNAPHVITPDWWTWLIGWLVERCTCGCGGRGCWSKTFIDLRVCKWTTCTAANISPALVSYCVSTGNRPGGNPALNPAYRALIGRLFLYAGNSHQSTPWLFLSWWNVMLTSVIGHFCSSILCLRLCFYARWQLGYCAL